MEYAAGHLADDILEKIHTPDRRNRSTDRNRQKQSGDCRNTRSYQEAEKAMELGEKMGLRREILFGKLAIYDYLLQYPVKDERDRCREYPIPAEV